MSVPAFFHFPRLVNPSLKYGGVSGGSSTCGRKSFNATLETAEVMKIHPGEVLALAVNPDHEPMSGGS